MTPKLPNARSHFYEWGEFHRDFVRFLHDLDDAPLRNLLREWMGPDAVEDINATQWGSPWTRGGCGALALVVAGWIGTHRATPITLTRDYDGDDGEPGFPHTIVRYRTARKDMPEVFFDGIEITTDIRNFLLDWDCDSWTEPGNDDAAMEHICENYVVSATDPRAQEILHQALVTRYGRWPRRR